MEIRKYGAYTTPPPLEVPEDDEGPAPRGDGGFDDGGRMLTRGLSPGLLLYPRACEIGLLLLVGMSEDRTVSEPCDLWDA